MLFCLKLTFIKLFVKLLFTAYFNVMIVINFIHEKNITGLKFITLFMTIQKWERTNTTSVVTYPRLSYTTQAELSTQFEISRQVHSMKYFRSDMPKCNAFPKLRNCHCLHHQCFTCSVCNAQPTAELKATAARSLHQSWEWRWELPKRWRSIASGQDLLTEMILTECNWVFVKLTLLLK